MKETKDKIISILTELYGPCDHHKYFFVTGRKEDDVREEILNKLKEDGVIRGKPDTFNLYIVTSQINDDVFIQV